jgi:hypothetical protein
MLRNIGVLLIAGALITGATEVRTSAANANPGIDHAVVEFNEPVTLMGVVLRGRFLFVHHQGMMARGRLCTFVYSLDPESEGSRVAAFHCNPVSRQKAVEFKLVTRTVPGHPPEVIEVQFAGSSTGHQVSNQEQEHP